MSACERCKGTGIDPENESVESYGDVERRLPEPCADCQLDDKPIEHGELWSLIDWSLWGSGMGDVFRESLADAFIRALTPEQIQKAEELMQGWHDSGREPLGRRRYEDLKKELDEARRPRRGDAVDQWLRTYRERYDRNGENSEFWHEFDGLLDLYRLHADTGTPLNEHVCEGQVVGQCECLESPPGASAEDLLPQPQSLSVTDLLGFITSTPEEPDPPVGDLEQQRAALLEAMRGVSEERWSAGWMGDLERRLYSEGGIWETIGRTVGWPTGKFDNWTWRTWDEAGEFFKNEKRPKVN